MADNYQQFSETLDNLTAEEEIWLNEQLQQILVFGDREYGEDDPGIPRISDPAYEGPRFLRDNPDFDSSYDMQDFAFAFSDDASPARNLWLYAESHGNPEHVAWLVQKFLKRFRPDQCWSLTYACTCSKPRVGEFGGGAVFVTAKEIQWQSTHEFIEQQRAAFDARTTGSAGGA